MDQSPAGQVTVDDVLRLVLPLNTAVFGANHSGRVVYWVSVMTELPVLEDQIEGGDIAILPAALQKKAGPLKLAKSLPKLGELSATALLTFQTPPDRVIQEATENGIPILFVPGKVSLREVYQGIASLLLDRQKQTIERGMQLYRKLTEMSREGKGLGAMTEVMSRLTDKIVVVQDKRLEIVAMVAPDDGQNDLELLRTVLSRHDELPPVLRNRKAAANSPQSHWQQQLAIGDDQVARLIGPIISGDRARGYVTVIGHPDELDLLDILTVHHGAVACSLEMAKAKAISEARKSLRGNFLEGLLAGTLPEKEIQRLAGRLDHDTGQPHAIMIFAWDGDKVPTLRRLETPLSWQLTSHNRPVLTHIYSADHICVFQALEDDGKDMTSAEELAKRLREHLRTEFPEARLLAGLSGPAESLAEWPVIYRQAVQAMHLAKRLQLDRLVQFNSVGIYQLLTQLEDITVVQDFRDLIIGPLVEYDQRHRSNLVQTLSAYFKHHANVSQTAETLYIHRNTLLYRLERIQELTGQSLENADERLALHLALKLWQIRPGR